MRTKLLDSFKSLLAATTIVGATIGNSASAELISYYFRTHGADLAGFASYELPPVGSNVLYNYDSVRVVGYPLDVFSFNWNGAQYTSYRSSEPPYVAVWDGKPAVSWSADEVFFLADTKSSSGDEVHISLRFEGVEGKNTILTSTALPADLTSWPNLGGPVFTAYRDGTRVLRDFDAEFGFLTDFASEIGADDFVWVGGSGDYQNSSAWSTAKVPSLFDSVLFSLAPSSTSVPESITFNKQAVVREIGFLGNRNLAFKLQGNLLSIGSDLVLGDKPGENQNLTIVNGAVQPPRFVVGRQGTGNLFVGDKGRLIAPLVIAEEQGSTGNVTLEGGNASWEIQYTLKPVTVGKRGDGTLSILNGAVMSMLYGLDPDLTIAEEKGSTGAVTIDGLGSQLLIDGALVVGAGGQGKLKVQGGGKAAGVPFESSEIARLIIGGTQFDSSGADGAVDIDGAGSTILANDLIVGERAHGALSVTGGAFVDAGRLAVGRSSRSVGEIVVSGLGSTLRADSLFPVIIGEFGRGSLTVTEKGRVETRGAASVGLFDIGGDKPSTIVVDDALWFSGEPTPFGVVGEVNLRRDSRMTVKNRGVVHTGTFRVLDNAHLHLDEGFIGAESLEIRRQATLSGNGMINGDVVNEGVIAPGNSPGVISIVGDFEQLSEGALRLELGGGGLPGVDYDLVEVFGMATLGGALEVVLLPGYLPTLDDMFTFLTADQIVGEFDQVRFVGGSAEITYASSGVRLSNVVFSGVPEPQSIALVWLGLAGAVWKRPRRSHNRFELNRTS